MPYRPDTDTRLAKAHATLLAAMEKSQRVGITVVDERNVTVYCNDAFLRMFSWPREALIGHKPPFVYWPPEHHEVIERVFGDAVAGRGPPSGSRLTLCRADGLRIPCLILPSRVRGEDGFEGWMACILDIRELAHAEQELVRSLQRFRELADMIEEVFYIVEPPHGIVYVSPSFRTVWGRDPAHILDRTESYLDAIVPEDRPLAIAAGEGQESGEVTRVEYRIRRPDGSVRWIWDQTFPIQDEAGRVTRVVGIATDITSRKLAELALARREALLARAEHVAQLGSWEIEDGPEPILRWSDQTYALLGYEPGSVEPSWEALLARVHPEDRARVQTMDRADGAARYEFRVLRPDGSVRYIQAWRDAGTAPAQSRIRAWGTIQDITQSTLDALARERSRLLLQEAQRLSQFISFQVNVAARTVEADDALPRMMGLDPAAARNELDDWLVHVHPEDRGELRIKMLRALRPLGGPQQTHFRIVLPEGKVRYVVGHVQPMPDPRDGSPGLLGTLQDNTEQVRAGQRLLQAQRLESLGQLTGGLAHDFGNLLQAIVGNLDHIGSALPPESPLRRQTDAALATALRGAELTRSLLAVARQQPMQLATIDLGQRLEETRPLLETSAGGRVELRLRYPADRVLVRLDMARLDSALLNLVVNARDAMPQGGQLEIELLTCSGRSGEPGLPAELIGHGRFALIRVLDTGTGIAPEVAERAFDPFFTTKPFGQGTGLGLPMVYGLTQQLGGTATITRREQGGTCVSLYLPIAADVPASERVPAPFRQRLQQHGDEHAGKLQETRSLLLVDDQLELLRATGLGLQRFGWTVTTAVSADEAARLLGTKKVDIVLTDVVMPGELDGIGLAKWIDANRPGLPVLLTTGYADAERLRSLAWPVLEKPYRTHHLHQLLLTLLETAELAQLPGP